MTLLHKFCRISSRTVFFCLNMCSCELNVKYYYHVGNIIVEGVFSDISMDKTKP